MNSYFEMPFRERARITITNEHPKDITSFFYTVNYAETDSLPENTLYFHAYWKRERQTELAKDYVILDEEFPTVSSTGSEDYFGGAWAFHQKDELGRPSVKNYSTLFLGYPFYETKDKTRVRFETGKLNAVHAFGDDSLPRHGLYRWHILDPIAFSEDIKVTLQQIGNDDLSLFERSDDVATVAYWYQDSAEGFDRAFPDRRARLPR